MDNIAILYFSGTGNTRYIAHRLYHKLDKFSVVVGSISKEHDFESILSFNDFIFFCYPVYGSTCPTVMEDFVIKHKDLLKGKDVGVIITQGGFSGDGAYYLGRILKKLGANVKVAEHFNMPDSITDNKTKPYKREDISKYLNEAGKKLDEFIDRFNRGKYIRRGFNPLSRMLGALQRVPWKAYYPKLQAMLKIDEAKCIGCGLCAKNCPVNNLEIVDGKSKKKDKCVLCYKCVNNCPKKAITIFGKNPIYQYKGIPTFIKEEKIL